MSSNLGMRCHGLNNNKKMTFLRIILLQYNILLCCANKYITHKLKKNKNTANNQMLRLLAFCAGVTKQTQNASRERET